MRRQIIQHLEREKTATFTQIMNLLELDPLWQCGTIGYHLNLLVDSGVVRKFEDGYVLTSRGRSLADLIDKIEYSEGSENMNGCEASEEVLGKLHPRFVCWLLTVAKGVKPVATILSVAKENWTGFVEVLNELDLCWSYKGINGMILSCQANEAERLLGHISAKSDRRRVNFLFHDENWAKLLYDAKSSSQVLSPSSAKSTPIIQQDLDIRDIVVSRDLERLIEFARLNQRTDEPSSWSNHIGRGKALGYPDCCIEAYDKGGKIGLVARRHFFKELTDPDLDEKMPVEFWAVAHVPCSAKCKESINLGKRYLGAVRSYSSSLYDSVLKRLRVSYIAYSVGESFLGFTEIPQEHLPLELGKEYS